MRKDKKLIDLWIKHGIFRMAEDNSPTWTEEFKSRSTAAMRNLLYYLPYGGRKEFDKMCSLAGYRPKDILQRFSLCGTDDSYGIPLDEFED